MPEGQTVAAMRCRGGDGGTKAKLYSPSHKQGSGPELSMPRFESQRAEGAFKKRYVDVYAIQTERAFHAMEKWGERERDGDISR